MTDGSAGAPPGESARTADRLRGALPAVLAVGILTAGAVFVAGPVGIVIAAVTAIAWALAPVPYALAAGHVALATLAPRGLAPLDIAIVEAGFVAVLAGSLVRAPAARDALAAAALTLAVTGGVAWAALATLPLWVAATVVALLLSAIGYGIHRYQLVAFGLLADGAGIADLGGPRAADDRAETPRGSDAPTTSRSDS